MENNYIVTQNIYSSIENQKILSGFMTAIEIAVNKKGKVICAIVYYGDVKVLIPITEMGIEKSIKNLRTIMGAKIEFVVIKYDVLTNTAVASRIQAMKIRQEIEFKKYYAGDEVEADVMGVGLKHMKINCLGLDVNMRIDEVDYGYIQDLNSFYKTGDVIRVKIKSIDKENYKLDLSIKDLKEDPYKRIRIYVTEGGEYIGEVTGNAPNGIYIRLRQGVDALATLPIWLNQSPKIGQKVAVRVVSINEKDRKIICKMLRIIK